MAHDYVKEAVEVEAETGRVSFQILATLVGGVLLVCSLVAEFSFDNPDYATALAMLSAVLLGVPLVWVAIKDLYEGHTHMNELVALAVLASFAIGKYQESAAIAFFMIIAVLIENRTALGAQASIESLVRITPTRAHRVRDGAETEVEAKDLMPGDIVRVRPGDNIPADGKVARGTSTVNQANITGESLPVDKNEGDEVFGGTINVTGAMDIQVTKAGSDTTLGKVKELILQAERTRIPIMRMIDRYAGWYTPTVLMLVGIVLFFTMKLGLENPWERAITMLVLACPCALILATPTAMVAGLSAAARLGVLVKSVLDLEAARNLTAIVFDKTGTLTTGQLQVRRLSPVADAVDSIEFVRVAASAEQHSKHPVARAVVDVARKARVTITEPTAFEEVSGRGVRATIDGRSVAVGRAKWLIESGGLDTATSAVVSEVQSSPDAEGLSVLFVVRDGRLLGWIGLEDATRPEAAAAMDRLREQGLKRLIIVTGDRESVAKRVAAEMHTDYKAEVLPHEKLEIVDELKARGHKVAVIGDGVNDAPALAAGDISIAMGAAGSDVAIHSASIALMNNNLNRIPFLVDLSRQTGAVIRQNLVFGISFVLIFGTLAAMNMLGGANGPIIAAVLHVVSSLIVVFNSARLVRAGEDIEMAEASAGQKRERRPAAVAPSPMPATA
ncbi:MAG: cation-translocating P-type ATPase [Planctomycetes bacterium]|nr:cation-translocating P-type ATPase [Planctomycetota bacterium]